MELIGNALNGRHLASLVKQVDRESLVEIKLAVAFVTKMDDLFELADKRRVPLSLYALADGDFPSLNVLKKFVNSGRPHWQLFLTSDFYHPKIIWFRGVGAYVGSANLTDGGLMRNLECGIWLDDADLRSRDWEQALSDMFAVIASRSTSASQEHIRAYEDLSARRSALERERRALAEAVRKTLKSVAGQQPPLDPFAHRGGGAARAEFLRQWHSGLTILRKMTEMMGQVRRPAWVDPKAPLSIVQDQATESWYNDEIRHSGESAERIEQLHKLHQADPESATRAVLERWARIADSDRWARWVNEHPAELRQLLSRDGLRDLTRPKLARILLLSHASREHGRQITKEELGLAPDANTPMEERSELFADLLLRSQSRGGKRVSEVLDYVIWGDDEERDGPERIWRGVYDPDWKIPHLGVNILGELVGYARPEEFPPRNGRVSKSLYALGYQGIRW